MYRNKAIITQDKDKLYRTRSMNCLIVILIHNLKSILKHKTTISTLDKVHWDACAQGFAV